MKRQTETVNRLHRPAVVLILTTTLAIGMIIGSDFFYRNYQKNIDFDIHYFGAKVERNGSYTETNRVRASQLAVRKHAQPEGVIGTPTLVALVYVPLSHLPLREAEILWKLLAMAIVIAGTSKAVKKSWRPYIPLVFCTAPVLLGLYVGNVSVMTFALVAYAYGAMKIGQSKRFGIALGIAIAWKLFPAFLLLAIIRHRQWQNVRWAIGVAIATSLLAIAILGLHDFALGMHRTLNFPLYDYGYRDNISIPGMLFWIFGIVPLSVVTTSVILIGGSVLVLVRNHNRPELTFAGMGLVLLLGNGLSWSHYFGIALLGLVALCEPNVQHGSRKLLIATTSIFFLPTVETRGIAFASAIYLMLLLVALRNPLDNPLPSNGNELTQVIR